MQADDLDAFEQFFARHRGLIERTAYALVGDRQAAEEVLQDTFLRAYRHRASLRTDVSPVPWLYRVALNLCYSRLARRRLREEPIGETTAALRDHTPEPADLVEREELRRSVRRGVAALPEKHQLVIVLYYLEGLSLQETAEALGIRIGTAKSRVHYGLRALRDRLVAEQPAGFIRPGHELEPVVAAARVRR
jgi:RNA polymerase sigma-70 factor (ECF subfamily)